MKIYRTLLCILALVLLTSTCACQTQESDVAAWERPIPSDYKFTEYFKSFIVNNNISKEDALTTEYDLNELISYFTPHHIWTKEKGVLDLTMKEINERFPIELTRENEYSVYKVKQGGYYYVFWINTTATEILQEDGSAVETDLEATMYFTAYFSGEYPSKSQFKKLKPGESTAQDIIAIDPNVGFDFWGSSNDSSYSLLEDDWIAEVRYERSSKREQYTSMVIEEVKFLRRSEAYGCFSGILPQDLP